MQMHTTTAMFIIWSQCRSLTCTVSYGCEEPGWSPSLPVFSPDLLPPCGSGQDLSTVLRPLADVVLLTDMLHVA